MLFIWVLGIFVQFVTLEQHKKAILKDILRVNMKKRKNVISVNFVTKNMQTHQVSDIILSQSMKEKHMLVTFVSIN